MTRHPNMVRRGLAFIIVLAAGCAGSPNSTIDSSAQTVLVPTIEGGPGSKPVVEPITSDVRTTTLTTTPSPTTTFPVVTTPVAITPAATVLATTTVAVPTVPAITTESPVSPPPSPLDPSGECTRSSGSIEVDGRHVLVESPDASGSTPVIIALHGYKGTPDGLAHYSQLDVLAATGGAIVVYPSGSPLDLGFGWNSGSTKFATKRVDDVAILADVADAVLGLGCADPSRVFLVGESNGGGMALRATCDSRFAGRVAGLVLVNPAIDAGVLATCTPLLSAVSVLGVAGRLDKVVPYDGSRAPFLAAETWRARVAELVARCDSDASHRIVSPTVVADDSAGCSACTTLYSIDDGGHTWPGAVDAVNGASIGTLPLTALIGTVVARQIGPCGS